MGQPNTLHLLVGGCCVSVGEDTETTPTPAQQLVLSVIKAVVECPFQSFQH